MIYEIYSYDVKQVGETDASTFSKVHLVTFKRVEGNRSSWKVSSGILSSLS